MLENYQNFLALGKMAPPKLNVCCQISSRVVLGKSPSGSELAVQGQPCQKQPESHILPLSCQQSSLSSRAYPQKMALQSLTEWKAEPEVMEEDLYKPGLSQKLVLKQLKRPSNARTWELQDDTVLGSKVVQRKPAPIASGDRIKESPGRHRGSEEAFSSQQGTPTEEHSPADAPETPSPQRD
ncbi:hypothetical protein U0070_023830 [Myodes glareolus]|uniref:Uncharacterized protein n=1 Tax=Myodes glareolus TaxID=447135 RepID=A0AAW0HTK7_MYOGA